MSTNPIIRPEPSIRRRVETLRANHNEAVRCFATLPVPPAPSVYDTRAELGFLLLDQVAYIRKVIDLLAPLFERCADDAADYGNARAECFDLVRSASEDFVAPIAKAAEDLVDPV